MPADFTENAPIGAAGGEGKEPANIGSAPSSLLQLPYTPRFAFLVNPKNWDVFVTDKGPELLPSVMKLPFQPGVNGVRKIQGQDEGDASHAIAVLTSEKHGWILVPPKMEVEAFGKKYTGYVHVYDGVAGDVHIERWLRPYAIGTDVYYRKDEAGWWKFLRQVRDTLLPPIDANVRESVRERLQQLLDLMQAGKDEKTRGEVRAKLKVFEVSEADKKKAAQASTAGKDPK